MGKPATILLEARIAAALTLRQFDDDCRRMGVKAMVGSLGASRRTLCGNLAEYGGQIWFYDPVEDNSWIPHA